ncbi:hypothetical protein PR202_ga31432 [Eleusine coracana subsp. coracana]|uniref:Uncharacterized protein n=1 Tax=Eleusine coracana subsp. coracana TaxID=191504 RepID=A0AAV5DRF5_ELECO|nr:hypothetical protein PR202_ga31432 [Eleusine coracana subsp. coracana]
MVADENQGNGASWIPVHARLGPQPSSARHMASHAKPSSDGALKLYVGIYRAANGSVDLDTAPAIDDVSGGETSFDFTPSQEGNCFASRWMLMLLGSKIR